MTAPASAGDSTDDLRAALLEHHPIMRSETGPLSGCRCGQVRLGQDVVAHVIDAILPVVSGWRCPSCDAITRARMADSPDPTEPRPLAEQTRDLLVVIQRLRAERADAQNAVVRVLRWAAMNDGMAREYDEAADAVTDSALVYGARERAEDCRAVAEGVRRALAGEP